MHQSRAYANKEGYEERGASVICRQPGIFFTQSGFHWPFRGGYPAVFERHVPSRCYDWQSGIITLSPPRMADSWADACRRDVCAEVFVNRRGTVVQNAAHEFIHKVGVGAVMPRARAGFQGVLRIERVVVLPTVNGYSFGGRSARWFGTCCWAISVRRLRPFQVRSERVVT